jgi:hypothetical protein
LLGDVNKLFVFKHLLTMFCLYTSSKLSCQYLNFFEGEGDGIESRLPFKIFSTLTPIDQHIRELLNCIHKYNRGIFDKLHPPFAQAQMTVSRETRLIQKLDMSQLNSLVSKTV